MCTSVYVNRIIFEQWFIQHSHPFSFQRIIYTHTQKTSWLCNALLKSQAAKIFYYLFLICCTWKSFKHTLLFSSTRQLMKLFLCYSHRHQEFNNKRCLNVTFHFTRSSINYKYLHWLSKIHNNLFVRFFIVILMM